MAWPPHLLLPAKASALLGRLHSRLEALATLQLPPMLRLGFVRVAIAIASPLPCPPIVGRMTQVLYANV